MWKRCNLSCFCFLLKNNYEYKSFLVRAVYSDVARWCLKVTDQLWKMPLMFFLSISATESLQLLVWLQNKSPIMETTEKRKNKMKISKMQLLIINGISLMSKVTILQIMILQQKFVTFIKTKNNSQKQIL